jgi:hypothetical protein
MDYKPLSREFLLQRGYCCENNCLNCPYKDNNMKTEKQYKDSMTNFIIGVVGMILTLIMVICLGKSPKNESIEKEYYKEPTKEDIDWTGTKQDN